MKCRSCKSETTTDGEDVMEVYACPTFDGDCLNCCGCPDHAGDPWFTCG